MGAMTQPEIDGFLESKLNIQLATVDEAGDPNIQPLWFLYDKGSKRLFVMAGKSTKKVENIHNNPSVYFSIDDESFPYKGVKGKGLRASLKTSGETCR